MFTERSLRVAWGTAVDGVPALGDVPVLVDGALEPVVGA